MTTPTVAVAVSAYNRSDLLPGLIAALKAQTLTTFEAFIVDNGSVDDTYAVLVRHTADDPRFHILQVQGNSGPARARNLAWRAASAPVVAFTDDDCLPDPDWLSAMVAATEEADVVQGRTVAAKHPPGVKPRWFDRSRDIASFSGRYETCNLAFRRETLEAVGGFVEDFSIAMGEDTDLGMRAVAAGATTAFADDAVVVHHQLPGTFGEFLNQRRRFAESVQMVAVNPDARRLLTFGLVERGVHLLVWALLPITVVSIVAGYWWVAPALVAAWILRHAIRQRNRPFPFPVIVYYCALQFVGYAYEAFCFAVASVRYRTLVI